MPLAAPLPAGLVDCGLPGPPLAALVTALRCEATVWAIGRRFEALLAPGPGVDALPLDGEEGDEDGDERELTGAVLGW